MIRQMGFLLAVLMGVVPMSAVADYSSHPSAAALADRAAVANKAQFAQHLASVTAIRNEWLPGIS